MNWGKRYPHQQATAREALLGVAQAASCALASFTGWLLVVSGASFAFIVAHIGVVAGYVRAACLGWALVLFALSLLFGLLAQWLGATTLGALAAISTMQQRAKTSDPLVGFKLLAFTKFFADTSLVVYRRSAWRGYKNVKACNTIAGIRPVVRRSQWQALLALLQLVLVFLSVLALALGIKA